MKNLAFLFLLLVLCTACKQKEEKTPIPPNQWLSQIKNEEAKKRTNDVLEKIYISTAYSVVEKDSLSKFQVQIANCQTPPSVEHFVYVFRYLESYTNNRSMGGRSNASMKYVSDLYQKDPLVSKAALGSMMDTTKIDFGRYHSFYKNKIQYSVKTEKQPSKELKKIEQELMSYLKVYPRYNSDERADSINKIYVLLKKALQQDKAFEYGLPKFVKENGILASENQKFRVYSYKVSHGNSASAYSYIHYRASDSSKSILKYLEYTEAIPKLVFQLEENKYGIFYDDGTGGMDYHVLLQVYEMKNNEIALCEDCVEGEDTKYYIKSSWGSTFPVFDSMKNEITFNYRKLYYGHVKEIDSQEKQEIRNQKRGSGEVMSRMTLKWNGQQFISIPLKLYCEE
ncbi:hypothetical protein WAF17_10095 [Bernardetia sp. ABR2-2B]|uniref:hypothetical protein n=1 Tax=Bernardetia sp. ABR2-2B TaxID=3127472 RepID=UPI0030D319C1